MIRGQTRQIGDLVEVEAESRVQPVVRRRSSDVTWEIGGVTLNMREQQNGHKGAVLWFTGLSGSGKSTVAKKVEQRLFELGCRTMFLDGDNLRHGLNSDLDFSDADRAENIRRAAEVARLGFAHGNITLCSFISPFQKDRDFARSLLPEGRFFEIYVQCDIEVCKRRDPKGLYAKALRGEISNFTGISSPYEAPENPELVVETDLRSTEEIVETIIEELVRRGILNQ
jgi:bifunctional enzyme CysN/CysC